MVVVPDEGMTLIVLSVGHDINSINAPSSVPEKSSLVSSISSSVPSIL